ncbi:MAG: phytoene desaturase family protein, partial [Gemmatimonadota bacterium]
AVALAEAGWSVRVYEARAEIGGAARTDELTIPGVLHDVGSAIHPLAAASPFFRRLPLARHGLEWIHPPLPLAHPLDGGRCVELHRSLDATAAGLGRDGAAWASLFGPLTAAWPKLEDDLLGPLLRFPSHPIATARFGLKALRSATGLASTKFAGTEARALFAGLAAHSTLALDRMGTASFGLVLGTLAHHVGWPFPRGGAGRITQALAAHLRELGGEIVTDAAIESLVDLPASRSVVLDLTPRQVLAVAGRDLSNGTRRALERYRYGTAAFKMDWVLDAPIPWAAAASRGAGTVHLGGTLEEIAAAEKAVANGSTPEAPFVLLAQPSMFDDARAPEGRYAVWAYCHVPHGSTRDMTRAIEDQVERFAPGFRDRIVARAAHAPADLEAMDANLVGGDINGGVQDLTQMLARPLLRRRPYRLKSQRLYICSSSTPPGGGVHGMCGLHAANTLLDDLPRR